MYLKLFSIDTLWSLLKLLGNKCLVCICSDMGKSLIEVMERMGFAFIACIFFHIERAVDFHQEGYGLKDFRLL